MTTTIKLPELGENVDSGELTRILVHPGDTITKDQALLELETEKATIEVPSPVSGVVKELHVQEGRKVKVGDLLFTVDENGSGGRPAGQREAQAASVQAPPAQERQSSSAPEREKTAASAPTAGATAKAKTSEVENRPERKAQLRSEETPKAKPQSKAQEDRTGAGAEPTLRTEPRGEVKREPLNGEEAEDGREENVETVIPFRAEAPEQARRHLAPASPAVRRFARELGVDINKVTGTGAEGRIDDEDVKSYARQIISRAGATAPQASGARFAELPDFAKWGQIERKPMSNVRRATAEHLAQAWHNVPQVTQFDRADITELEKLRSQFSPGAEGGAKITVTSIALKVIAAALGQFPKFAASIDLANREIIYKHYCNIGIAVDTSYGLVVPVVRDADQKSILQLAKELTELSEKARQKKLGLEEMAGGVFTITNLGGIGGTGFSPIVNYPEVAILGISRVSLEPRQIDGSFQARKILPISLSYDHRLIDGAEAARFLRWVAEALEQPALLLFRS